MTLPAPTAALPPLDALNACWPLGQTHSYGLTVAEETRRQMASIDVAVAPVTGLRRDPRGQNWWERRKRPGRPSGSAIVRYSGVAQARVRADIGGSA